ncbi:Pex19-domain-containing protein [Microstroma glucosiphilum]|uniref:Pex19-domain-containing protein n=1 Tax=Pseudomicrostroma glucosiphilum TaxID=1684307 RepID=A0A316U543_9BASI|nr:Pex19-domain-containing protein [Pseudomicrostroma glucosiphilum]PWN20377.1 Pex19-domain-containing protein [Pseudomicrostroma glucosiphilum]
MSSSHKNIKEEAQDDDDDVDELDDVLDQFDPSSSTTPAKPAATTTTASQQLPSGRTRVEDGPQEDGLTPEFDDLLSQQFAKELAKGMEDMFGAGAGAAAASGGSTAGPAAGAGGAQPEMSEEEMMKQFEKIMQEMGLGEEGMAALGGGSAAGAAPPAGTRGAAGGSAPSTSGDPANFQDAIKSTMSRLRQSQGSSGAGSSSKAGGADPFADFSDDDMAKLLQGLGGEGGLPEGEEGMASMLEKMMGELMSKEVLYEPLKELRDKYPPYFASPPTSPAPTEDDLQRYHDQHDCVSKVVKLFEDPDFDSGSESRKKELRDRVSELMNQMQESGAPPPEVVGDMPAELENIPGFGGAGGNGQPGDEECIVM